MSTVPVTGRPSEACKARTAAAVESPAVRADISAGSMVASRPRMRAARAIVRCSFAVCRLDDNFWVRAASRSAPSVRSPSTPSTRKPLAAWNPRTASAVESPNMRRSVSSASAGKPTVASSSCVFAVRYGLAATCSWLALATNRDTVVSSATPVAGSPTSRWNSLSAPLAAVAAATGRPPGGGVCPDRDRRTAAAAIARRLPSGIASRPRADSMVGPDMVSSCCGSLRFR